jgi:hypothetical protein
VKALVILALAAPLFFDDFSHAGVDGLRGHGWTLRSDAGHPGVPGARWAPDGIALVDDPALPGNRLLRLSAQTDGTPAGTTQAQVCHQRKLLRGTYAARVRFTDAPAAGRDGDPVIQAFYALSPLQHDLDPTFSEVDFEYLPNGGWGSAATRLYAISWQTVQIEPWRAFNAAHEAAGSHAGWRVLTVHVSDTTTRHHLDGRLLATHGGRNVPTVPMSMNLSLWFSPGGLLPASTEPRRWVMEVDWVLHAAGVQLTHQAVLAEVARLRAAGRPVVDTVPPAAPALASPCNL